MVMPIFGRTSLPIIRLHLQCSESKTSALMLPVIAFPNCGNLICSRVALLLELKPPMAMVALFAAPLFGTAPKGKIDFLINIVCKLPKSGGTVNDLCGDVPWMRVAEMHAIGAMSLAASCICCPLDCPLICLTSSVLIICVFCCQLDFQKSLFCFCFVFVVDLWLTLDFLFVHHQLMP